MARTNYKFKKRQKELKKQKKREEKLLRKHGKTGPEDGADADRSENEDAPPAADTISEREGPATAVNGGEKGIDR